MAIDNIPLTYHASKRRKTFGLKVMAEQVKVYYPHRACLSDVHSWVASQSSWIEKHWVNLQLRAPAMSVCELPGTLWWRGKKVPIAEFANECGLAPSFWAKDFDEQKKQLLRALQTKAERMLPPFLAAAERRLEASSNSLKIRAYKSRWGACDRRRNVTLNSLLVMAPEPVVDYVACHEIAHIYYLNHSPAFWHTVRKVCRAEQVADAKAWLKAHGSELTFLLR